MKEVIVKTPIDYHQFIMEHWKSDYIYRGEDSNNYKLIPKIGRDILLDKKNNIESENNLLKEFYKISLPYIQIVPENAWERLALAQHHGLHTRFLDWSKNPLVAAYFAIKSMNTNDAVVYCFKTKDLSFVYEKIMSPYNVKNTTLYNPRHISNRIIAQAGIFTFHPNPTEEFSVPSLEKIIIPRENKSEMYGMLYSYNINESTLFPDLDGIARYLNQVCLF